MRWPQWGAGARRVDPARGGPAGCAHNPANTTLAGVERVVGMGVDVERVDRFRQPRRGLFTDAEVAYCTAQGDPAEAFAGTWCAKEAAVKALTEYMRVLPRDIEVTRDANGAPRAEVRAATTGSGALPNLHVSITHADGLAVAVAAAVLQDAP